MKQKKKKWLRPEQKFLLWMSSALALILLGYLLAAQGIENSRAQQAAIANANAKAAAGDVKLRAVETAPEFDDESEEENLSLREQKALAFMIDGEAGDEPYEGKKGVAFVALGRARDNKPYWGGKTIVGVVCKHDKTKSGVRWQFDGAKRACLSNFAGKPSDVAMDLAGKILIGEIQPTEEEARWRYFFNQYESGLGGAAYLLCETKISRTIGGHIFGEPKQTKRVCKIYRRDTPKAPVVAKHKQEPSLLAKLVQPAKPAKTRHQKVAKR